MKDMGIPVMMDAIFAALASVKITFGDYFTRILNCRRNQVMECSSSERRNPMENTLTWSSLSFTVRAIKGNPNLFETCFQSVKTLGTLLNVW